MNAGLAPFVAILGRGATLSRGLSEAEAEEAMGVILRGGAAPEAVGAFLMLLRMKGETAEEIAGLVRGARAGIGVPGHVALDWPSYAAGRTRGLPWFLLSARLVARAGYPVLLHGWNSHQATHASVRGALPLAGIAQAGAVSDIDRLLARDRIAYLPLEVMSPALYHLLRLRDVLGLRSCINTVLRVLNPAGAGASVQGVFHPPYREVQRDAAARLGQTAMTVLKGGGGEFERSPGKEIALFGLRDGQPWEDSAAALQPGKVRLAEGPARNDPAALDDLWSGVWVDDYARDIVIGTAEIALRTLGAGVRADALWHARHETRAA